MTGHRFIGPFACVYLLLAALASLTGCASPRTQSFAPPLPPAPPPVAADPAPGGGALSAAPSLFTLEGVRIPPEHRHLPLEPTPEETLLRRADMLADAGRLHYRAGELEAARREFDSAIDTLLGAPLATPWRSRINRKIAELAEEIYGYDIAGLGAGQIPDEPVFDKAPIEEIPELTFPVDPKQRSEVADAVRATVSQLPLEVSDEVLRYISFFSSGRGQKIMTYGLRRAGRYRPLIYRILDEEGVPRELIHLAQAESGFSPRAVSRMKATGMWQFMLSRGREYGLIRTRSADDRMDPEKATRAAARHLRDLYTQFGDWYLAMAAYNCGPGTVQRAVERTGYADFWELRRRNVLPKETANYVPVILAMIIMAKNPAAYGLDTVEADSPVEYSTVETASSTHLALIADITGATVSEIQELNPALLRNVAPAGYLLRVPNGTASRVAAILDLIPPEQRTAWRAHRVREGETLPAIARLYRASAESISRVNHLEAGLPDDGMLLLIPAAPQVVKPASRSAQTKTAARGNAGSRTAPAAARTAAGRTASVAALKRAGGRPRANLAR